MRCTVLLQIPYEHRLYGFVLMITKGRKIGFAYIYRKTWAEALSGNYRGLIKYAIINRKKYFAKNQWKLIF